YLVRVSFMYATRDHRHLHSFPTRRSSDLNRFGRSRPSCYGREAARRCSAATPRRPSRGSPWLSSASRVGRCSTPRPSWRWRPWRSEEHTSELQSRSDLVCRLLLEKKNTIL